MQKRGSVIYRLTTKPDSNGWRIDQYLAEKTSLSRTTIRKIIDLGGMHLDGRRIRKCGLLVQDGQQIELHKDKQPLTPFRLLQEHILFWDKHLIVINKPAGINTQPTPARYKGTLHEALHFLLKNQGQAKPTTGMHQRLDRDTSGLLLFSLNPAAHKNIARQMQQRTIRRTYLALVEGIVSPPAGTIRSNLARRRCNNQVVVVDKGGKKAITHYTTRALFSTGKENCTLLSITLETGRSHQIRAHFAEKGHPLLGDALYGGARVHHGKTYQRQCLHSLRLSFFHPESKKEMIFEQPPPEEILP